MIVSLEIKSLLRSIENSRFIPRSRTVARLLTQKIANLEVLKNHIVLSAFLENSIVFKYRRGACLVLPRASYDHAIKLGLNSLLLQSLGKDNVPVTIFLTAHETEIKYLP